MAEAEYGYTDEELEGRALLQTFVHQTLKDRKEKIQQSKDAYSDCVGKTLGELAKATKLPEMTDSEYAASLVDVLLNWRPSKGTMPYAAMGEQPCEIFEADVEDVLKSRKLIAVGEPLSAVMQKMPELADRTILRANDYFGVAVLYVSKESGPGEQGSDN